MQTCNLRMVMGILLTLLSILRLSHSDFIPIENKYPEKINPVVHQNMYTYAHLIDISYCISATSGIQEPFNCELSCEKRFPNLTLVYQWYFDDSVCGYIATTYSNIFEYDDTATPKKTIIVSLRGTRSIFDSYADIKVDMIGYSNMGSQIPKCGENCRVHKGFYKYFISTLINIDSILRNELDSDEDYELLILGHSLGGAIGLFLGIHYLDLGYDKLTLVTMGQPLIGNHDFTKFVDQIMGSSLPIEHNTFDRKYFRVIHKNDVVTVLPNNGNLLDEYSQFDNQIYLNCSSAETSPSNEQVVNCFDSENINCIQGDFDRYINVFSRNYLEIHISYFRRMGLCGIKIYED